jgi:hypothetical protein
VWKATARNRGRRRDGSESVAEFARGRCVRGDPVGVEFGNARALEGESGGRLLGTTSGANEDVDERPWSISNVEMLPREE